MNAKELKTCADWYDVDSIHASIQRQLKCGPITRMVESVPAAPPSDIGSREFAEWYARNLRLAMAKGMALAQREKPTYRPPQPSDDGKRCFLEIYKNAPARLYEIRRVDGGRWEYFSEYACCWYVFTGGVWPCERPERGA